MNDIELQYERLRRCCAKCEKEYDAVDLLDLSLALRVWADLKGSLQKDARRFATSLIFKTGSPSRKSVNRVRNFVSVFTVLPVPVQSWATHGNLMEVSTHGLDYGQSRSVGGMFKVNENNSVEMRSYWAVDSLLSDEDRSAMKNSKISRCNFMQWLGAEVVRRNAPDDDGTMRTRVLTREKLIRRMANAFGGAHPISSSADFKDADDPVIRSLFEYSILGLPVPYLILLGTAQNLLSNFESEYAVTEDAR